LNDEVFEESSYANNPGMCICKILNADYMNDDGLG